MKKILYFAFLLTLVYSCKPTAATPSGNSTPEPLQNEKTEFRVSGSVMITEGYCGGVAPSEEMLERLQTPHPKAAFKLIIKRGSTHDLSLPPLREVTTDAEGKFECQLPKGEYCLLIEEKNSKKDSASTANDYLRFDSKCHEKWLKTCSLSFEVKDAPVQNVNLSLKKRCFLNVFDPCVQYTGPWPP